MTGRRLQQPHLRVGVDRPLDVLRPAVDGGDLGGQLDEPPEVAAGSSLRAVVGGEVEDLGCSTGRARTGSRRPRRSPAARGRRVTALTTRRSVRPVTGSMPNITPPYAGSISGWTSTAIGWSAAPARCRESSTAVTASTNASKPRDADDRLELAGHRRRRHVLDHRRAAGDQRLLVAARPLERVAHGVVGCARRRRHRRRPRTRS